MKTSALALAVSLLGAVANSFPSKSPEGAVEPVTLPGGVTDAAGQVVYLTDHGRRIVALDGADGSVLWESDVAARPLALVDERLIALKGGLGELRIAILDASTGYLRKESGSVPIPVWADLRPGADLSGARGHLEASARLAGGDVIVKWSASRAYTGGANPGPEILAAYRASGVFKVTLESGDVEALPDGAWTFVSSFEGGRPIRALPEPVQAAARREHWELGRVVGERAFGKLHRPAPKRVGDEARLVTVVQAVAVSTGEVLWERSYAERAVGLSDSMRQP